MPKWLLTAVQAAKKLGNTGQCNPFTTRCSASSSRPLEKVLSIMGQGVSIYSERLDTINFGTIVGAPSATDYVLTTYRDTQVSESQSQTHGTSASNEERPAPRTKVSIILYSDSSFCSPCRKLDQVLWEGIGRKKEELLALYRTKDFDKVKTILREGLIEAFSKKGIDLDFSVHKTGSPTGYIPYMTINGAVVVEGQALLSALKEAPEPKSQTEPETPAPPSRVGCDQQKDEWGCFCLYAPPQPTRYNPESERRFADACLNAMGDPQQPERWDPFYNCKEIKSFKMVEGASGRTEYVGFEDWIRQISAGPPPVKCFRGFMYSHSNGNANTVVDRTMPIVQCLQIDGTVRCFSLHDCGCKTAYNPKFICDRAAAIQKELKAANSPMVVYFDAAKDTQLLPGNLQQLSKEKICAGNPDGYIVDEFLWRRVAITKNSIGVYVHTKTSNAPGAPASKWVWKRLSPQEFQDYCAGRLK